MFTYKFDPQVGERSFYLWSQKRIIGYPVILAFIGAVEEYPSVRRYKLSCFVEEARTRGFEIVHAKHGQEIVGKQLASYDNKVVYVAGSRAGAHVEPFIRRLVKRGGARMIYFLPNYSADESFEQLAAVSVRLNKIIPITGMFSRL